MKWYDDDHMHPDGENPQDRPAETENTQTASAAESRTAEEMTAAGEKQPEAPETPAESGKSGAASTPDQSAMGSQHAGSYSYTRENIPDNTYRTSPYPNQNSAPHSQGDPYQPGRTDTQNSGQHTPYGVPQNGAGQNQNGSYPHGASWNNPGQSPYNQNRQDYSQNPYNPVQNGSRISYTPDKKTARARKKGSGKKAAVAVACCAGILLSTGFGFLGAVIANRMLPAAGQSGNVVVDTEGNVVSEPGRTAVFYKSVENLATSTAENGGDLSLAQVSALVADSVVEITTEYTVSGWFQYVSGGAGSGVILSEDGYIVTNNHVICSDDGVTPADTITVRLTSGEEHAATLVGTDSDSDIAILKIDASGLSPAVCGNSDKLAVGESVLAVGNPLGELGGTKTEGIISALDREIDVGGTPMTLMQTSAAVNPGNSGGGLFNMRGELIGIVNAKSSGTGIEGLGFAIPINDALGVTEQLMEFGYVRGKITLGITFYDVTSSTNAWRLGVNHYGVYVVELINGYNDEVLKLRDRVIAVDGQEVSSGSDITSILAGHEVGDVLKFQISRNGSIKEVEVTCYEKVPAAVGEVEFEQ